MGSDIEKLTRNVVGSLRGFLWKPGESQLLWFLSEATGCALRARIRERSDAAGADTCRRAWVLRAPSRSRRLARDPRTPRSCKHRCLTSFRPSDRKRANGGGGQETGVKSREDESQESRREETGVKRRRRWSLTPPLHCAGEPGARIPSPPVRPGRLGSQRISFMTSRHVVIAPTVVRHPIGRGVAWSFERPLPAEIPDHPSSGHRSAGYRTPPHRALWPQQAARSRERGSGPRNFAFRNGRSGGLPRDPQTRIPRKQRRLWQRITGIRAPGSRAQDDTPGGSPRCGL